VSVTDAAIEKIKGMIVSGELRPGDRLPKEADLAERLGLSRNSLREAVRALSLVRILDVRQGDGTYVTSLESDVLLDAMSFVVDLHQDRGVLHVLEARRVLEAAVTALAAQYIEEDELIELQRLIDTAGDCATVEEFVENDLEFHRKIARASRNPVLASLLDSISTRTSRARIWRGITQSGATERAVAEHRAILVTLEHRRPDLARARATVHVAGVEEWVELALDPDDAHAAAAFSRHAGPLGNA
jgi:GntR family transcriptional regulator, transcriptional repressor for pyruvate dehydrogenase complex